MVTKNLKKWFQRMKISGSFSSWNELICDVPQGYLLGAVRLNMYLNDSFYQAELITVCTFADDPSFHACYSDLFRFDKVMISD